MRLLLDTHTFLWAISDEPRLGPRSRALITTEASSVLISHVSLWEIWGSPKITDRSIGVTP
jgi:PIN domain nuclease of toxin-antitoxin system